jgi:hypothetical protein
VSHWVRLRRTSVASERIGFVGGRTDESLRGSQAGWELSLSDIGFYEVVSGDAVRFVPGAARSRVNGSRPAARRRSIVHMLYQMTLMLAVLDPFVGVQAQQLVAVAGQPTHYTNYAAAYREAQRAKKPLLAILNPSEESSSVKVEEVRKTQQRRELLQKFVVVVIDTSTNHGETVNKLFNEQSLPHVSVIDRDQQWQLFRTSKKLQGEDWNRVLETFQNGEQTARLTLDVKLPCFT